jgi:hypothetical protein
MAKGVYSGLYADWVAANGGGDDGKLIANKAAMADANGSYMGWLAQRQAFLDYTELVIAGHTHTPISGLDGSLVNYVNTGFECPAVPDLAKLAISFATVDLDSGQTQVWQVVSRHGELEVVACPAESARVVEGASEDFSCYVTIDNRTGTHDLTLSNFHADNGHFVVQPPRQIPAKSSASFWVQDYTGIQGSQGKVTYHGSGEDLDLQFACPVWSKNQCSGASYRAKAGDGPWQDDQVSGSGHPLYVQFTTAGS